jgi:glycosyltransferase involved in cell wall biosynthesis
VSEYAKRGAIDHAGASASRVDVIHEGVDLERFRPGQAPGDGGFVFYVGAWAPHKNIPALIAAFDALDVPHELVIAGLPAWGSEAVQAAIARAQRRDRISTIGFITDEEKIDRMQRAAAFVYPSLAEGFGLPVLEAMACGAPVIATTGSAPEEFAKGAAVLVPPGDVEALTEALRDVLCVPARAAELRRAGPARAQGFTWEKAAAATIDVWKAAAGA